MKYVIAGGSGFLGRPLADALTRDGHEVVVLSRQPAPSAATRIRTVPWQPNGAAGIWASELEGASAVVNLAGESIGRRWSKARRRRILDSRVLATRSLVAAIQQSREAPSLLLSGSAVGYYGRCGDGVVTEEHPAGSDFLADVCRAWEAEAAKAAGPRTRVVCLRTGLVLERGGGALPKMLPPFWFGAGGRVGSGQQYWPWIHLRDWIGVARCAIDSSTATGALNATAPVPVTNAEFARRLGRALHRPSLIPTPGFALKLLMGEMADGLLLSGQRAVPVKAERLGYRFAFRDLDSALSAIFPGR